MVQHAGADQPDFAPVLRGPLVSCDNVFTAPELDAIAHLGDSLPAPGIFPRDARTETFHRRIEDAVLAANGRIFRFDLFALSPLRYAVQREGDSAEDWRKDYDRDLARKTQDVGKLSFCLQLSDASDYAGGDLEVRAGHGADVAPRDRGCLIGFPAYALYRVTPVRSGIRKSLLLWAAGPDFR